MAEVPCRVGPSGRTRASGPRVRSLHAQRVAVCAYRLDTDPGAIAFRFKLLLAENEPATRRDRVAHVQLRPWLTRPTRACVSLQKRRAVPSAPIYTPAATGLTITWNNHVAARQRHGPVGIHGSSSVRGILFWLMGTLRASAHALRLDSDAPEDDIRHYLVRETPRFPRMGLNAMPGSRQYAPKATAYNMVSVAER